MPHRAGASPPRYPSNLPSNLPTSNASPPRYRSNHSTSSASPPRYSGHGASPPRHPGPRVLCHEGAQASLITRRVSPPSYASSLTRRSQSRSQNDLFSRSLTEYKSEYAGSVSGRSTHSDGKGGTGSAPGGSFSRSNPISNRRVSPLPNKASPNTTRRASPRPNKASPIPKRFSPAPASFPFSPNLK